MGEDKVGDERLIFNRVRSKIVRNRMPDIQSLERSFIFFPEKELWASPSDGGMEYEDVYLPCPDRVRIGRI
jgi:hypothetical protein